MSPAARVVFSTWCAIGGWLASTTHIGLTGNLVGSVNASWAKVESLWLAIAIGIAVALVCGYVFYWGLGYFGGLGRTVIVNRPQSVAFLAGGAAWFVARGAFAMFAGVMGPFLVVALGSLAMSVFFLAAAYVQWFTRPRE